MSKFSSALAGAVAAIGLLTSAAAATNGLDAKFGTGGVMLLGPTPTATARISGICRTRPFCGAG